MLSNQIFDVLPIPVFALSILLMLFMHTMLAFIVGGAIIAMVCFALYRRLIDVGTEPDVLA